MEQQQMPADQPEDEINLLELLMVLAKHMRLIVIITLLAAAVSIGVSLLLPNIYTATAKVLPPQKEGGGSLPPLDSWVAWPPLPDLVERRIFMFPF